MEKNKKYFHSPSAELFQEQHQAPGASPHLKSPATTQKIMGYVCLSLLPIVLFSGYLFGVVVWRNYLLASATALLGELLWFKLTKQKMLWDFSCIVTALLLTMNLPPSAPWYFPIIGSGFAIIVVKQFFGGLGFNFLNPALGGRALLVLLFFKEMFQISWPDPPFAKIEPAVVTATLQQEALSGATPLAQMAQGAQLTNQQLWQSFWGVIGGRTGETSAFLILLGASFLLYKKIIHPRIPVTIIAVVALGAFIFAGDGLFQGSWRDVLGHVLNGGLLLGAFYMATDYVTSPNTKLGEYLFAASIGGLILLFRFLGATHEGVSYAILIMNCLVPLIDYLMRQRVLGEKRGAIGVVWKVPED